MNDHTTIPEKRCTKCGEKYPATPEYFYRRKRSRDGLSSRCKTCKRDDNRAWRAANPERAREYSRTWNATNPERKREKSRAWAAAHPEHARERRREVSRAWYAANTEVARKYARAWRAANPQRIRVYNQNHRARRRSLPDTFTTEQQNFALEYFGSVCAVCGRPFFDLFGERQLHMDHWIPLSSPDCPGSVATNMIPLCGGIDGCNTSKRARPPEEWLSQRFGKQEARKIAERIERYFEVVARLTN